MPSTSRRPGEHVFDDRIGDLAFGLEHFQNLIAEEIFQILWLWTRCHLEYPVIGKTAICDDGMQMGIEILKLTEALNGDGSAGRDIVIRDGLFEVGV